MERTLHSIKLNQPQLAQSRCPSLILTLCTLFCSEPVDLVLLTWCELDCLGWPGKWLTVEKARVGPAEDSINPGGRHRQGPTTLALARESEAIGVYTSSVAGSGAYSSRGWPTRAGSGRRSASGTTHTPDNFGAEPTEKATETWLTAGAYTHLQKCW